MREHTIKFKIVGYLTYNKKYYKVPFFIINMKKGFVIIAFVFILLGTVSAADLFFDDFESGTLNGWVLFANAGAQNWTANQTNPYEGNWHAQSQPRDTAPMPASKMEHDVNTIAYSNITFSYYRKLVGFDAGDEFRTKWFDVTNWIILENTPEKSINDANYSFRSYSLPASAANNPNFKIRFECTAGAVSEYCRVDNVRVTGETVISIGNWAGSFEYMPDNWYSVLVNQSDHTVIFRGLNQSNQYDLFVAPFNVQGFTKRINYVWFYGWFDNSNLYINQYVKLNNVVAAPAIQLSNPDLYFSSLIIPNIPYLGLSNEPVEVTINSVQNTSKLYPTSYPISLVSYSYIEPVWQTGGHAYGSTLFETQLVQIGNSSTISVSQWVKEDLASNGLNPRWTVPLTAA